VKIVYLEWMDHFSTPGWLTAAEIDYNQICISVGIVVAEDKKFLTISNTCHAGDNWADPLTIIKSAIVKRKTIKLGGKRGKV